MEPLGAEGGGGAPGAAVMKAWPAGFVTFLLVVLRILYCFKAADFVADDAQGPAVLIESLGRLYCPARVVAITSFNPSSKYLRLTQSSYSSPPASSMSCSNS